MKLRLVNIAICLGGAIIGLLAHTKSGLWLSGFNAGMGYFNIIAYIHERRERKLFERFYSMSSYNIATMDNKFNGN